MYAFYTDLLILAPLQVHFARQSKDRDIPWSVLNILKFGLTACLVLLCCIDFGYEIHNQGTASPSIFSLQEPSTIKYFLWVRDNFRVRANIFCIGNSPSNE